MIKAENVTTRLRPRGPFEDLLRPAVVEEHEGQGLFQRYYFFLSKIHVSFSGVLIRPLLLTRVGVSKEPE